MDESVREKLKNLIEFSKNIKDLKEISNLSIDRIIGITEKNAEILNEKFNVSKIGELASLELDVNEIRSLGSYGINRKDLINWILLSKMINNTSIEDYLGPKKISIVGLDNAGKTAIFQVLKDRVRINTFGKISPTKGVYRESIKKGNMEYVIWDMGGQKIYRQQYLKKAERYFIQNELIMFVIDVQDKNNYNSSIMYLKDVISSLEYLQENPKFLIIIHKVDPDIQDDKEIIDNIQFLEKKIHEGFKNKDFDYEISKFSIYQKLTRDKKITKEIKEMIIPEVPKNLETEGESDFSSMLEKTLNFMINLSGSIEKRLTDIENRMNYFDEWIEYIQQSSTLTPPQLDKEKTDKIVAKTLSVKEAVANELKSILKMRKIE